MRSSPLLTLYDYHDSIEVTIMIVFFMRRGARGSLLPRQHAPRAASRGKIFPTRLISWIGGDHTK